MSEVCTIKVAPLHRYQFYLFFKNFEATQTALHLRQLYERLAACAKKKKSRLRHFEHRPAEMVVIYWITKQIHPPSQPDVCSQIISKYEHLYILMTLVHSWLMSATWWEKHEMSSRNAFWISRWSENVHIDSIHAVFFFFCFVFSSRCCKS